MSNCPICGNTAKPGERFCLKCGYNFPDQMNQPSPGYVAPVQQGMPAGAQMQQPVQNYGAPTGQSNNYGAPAQQNVSYYGQGMGQNAAPKKKTKTPLIIAIAVAIAGLIAVGVYFFLNMTPGYEGVVKKFCKAIEENDEDLYDEIQDEYFEEFLGTLSGIMELAGSKEASNQLDHLFDAIVEEYAGDIRPKDISKVEYEITNVEDPDPDILSDMFEERAGMDIDELREMLELYGSAFSKSQKKTIDKLIDTFDNYSTVIEEADESYRVDFTIIVYGKNEKDKEKNKTSIVVLKKDGKWTMIPNFGAVDL